MTSGVSPDRLSGTIGAERARCRRNISQPDADDDTAGPVTLPAADPSYTWPAAAADPAPSTLLLCRLESPKDSRIPAAASIQFS